MKGMVFQPYYCELGEDPFESIQWEHRTAQIKDNDGNIVFEQKDVEVPSFWSQLATDIAASKYFRRAGVSTKSGREYSIRQLVSRVADSITVSGREQGNYFATEKDANTFRRELTFILVNQLAAFNSPVWFNCGLYHKYGVEGEKGNFHLDPDDKIVKQVDNYKFPQQSACFIQSVDDSIDSMVHLQKSEIKLFKYGSGTGTNFSKIRAKGEPLSGGGEGSGVLSFLEGFDTWAGCIKSGGTTRRSAKMVILDMDHPEIEKFIQWKVKEERKAKALIAAGYDSNFNGEAYRTVSGQNSNNSVRIPDSFMECYDRNGLWETFYRTEPHVGSGERPARELMDMIAEAAWECADPGVQFHDTIQKWHTCKSTGPINASNPCSEFLFLDNTSCNLSSINLEEFIDSFGNLDETGFKQTIKVLTTAMDIIVDMSSYPTKRIAAETHNFRPLGLGYSNLGSVLMKLGLPYDSDEARNLAAYVTSYLTGYGYLVSAMLAQSKGCFAGYSWNKADMINVIRMHKEASIGVEYKKKDTVRIWADALNLGQDYGFRNSQLSVIAPTGTISFFMDCDTLGIEPDFSLVKYKTLAGGGNLKIVNQNIKPALRNLGYPQEEIDDAVKYILDNGTVKNSPFIRTHDYPVFDCAVAPFGSDRVIDYMAHVKMVAAVQPFVSGGISKTVNLPENVTPEDIKDLYMEAWRSGVKCLSVYRDNCKSSQPLSTKKEGDKVIEKEPEVVDVDKNDDQVIPQRRKLPDTRDAIAHRFEISGHKGYLHVGLYKDGRPGEVFIRMAKEGSTLSGMIDTVATLISISLQNGVPLQSLVDKFKDMNFEPHGFTSNEDIPTATSIVDYIFRWLENKFGGENG